MAFECPKGLVSGELAALVEGYLLWQLAGKPVRAEMLAREFEAFTILEKEESRR